MKEKVLVEHVAILENMLKEFKEAKEKGKQTNENDVRARSIEKIEDITERLEQYIRNNEDLLQQISGREIDISTKVNWNDIVRPQHFEEDLEEEIKKLKTKVA